MVEYLTLYKIIIIRVPKDKVFIFFFFISCLLERWLSEVYFADKVCSMDTRTYVRKHRRFK